MLLTHLEKIQNFKEINKEILDIIDRIGFQNNQISCQNLFDGQNEWYNNNGSLKDLEEQDETKYSFVNNDLKGSLVESMINRFRSFRTRIMLMPPRRCYSVHSDPYKRIHVPITTSDQCWMVWPIEKQCFRLLEGRIYLTDTTKLHTFFNGHENLNRIHLVMSIKEENFLESI